MGGGDKCRRPEVRNRRHKPPATPPRLLLFPPLQKGGRGDLLFSH
ncbi:hypothetical protein AZ78_3081 [Lysobacter capsici AZ78]|uniref:Uncharacterized protein n=1 Tax=Lysobacter capsici AZ78 TaxID=1444315 RepID=A0A108UAF9_9GAMM|nr:hypothetical protein AZ78_3081 [Lysobacter capsici AZ78]